MGKLFNCLKERWLIDQISSSDIRKILDKKIKFYVGFDPTADSLHLGNLVSLVLSCWLKRFGHEAYFLIGGATGKIGDPSGKSIERPFLDEKILSDNVDAIYSLVKNIFQREEENGKISILNNEKWFQQIYFIEFLRDVGKYFRLGQMLGKESVKARLKNTLEGMSFTEFSYQILQAYDFYYLFHHFGIQLQLGGSDQWGNITAGIELIRKISADRVYGMTFPLLTRSDGKKFGKSEEGAIWLSEEKLSPYQFYQQLVRVSDRDVICLMRMLTFMDMEEIHQYEKELKKKPNAAQKKLAQEVTYFIHGKKGVEKAKKVTAGASPGKDTMLNREVLAAIAEDMPHISLSIEKVIGKKVVELMLEVGLVKSKSEGVRLIKSGGAYLNNKKIEDVQLLLIEKDIIDRSYLLLAKGRKKKFLIKIK